MFGLPYKLIGLIAGVALLAFWALFTVNLIEDRGKLKASLDAALDIANANAEAAQSQRAEFDRIQSETVAAAVQKAVIRERADARRKAITDAPLSDDGPVAAVLRRTLDSLPEPKSADQGGAVTPAGHSGRIASAKP